MLRAQRFHRTVKCRVKCHGISICIAEHRSAVQMTLRYSCIADTFLIMSADQRDLVDQLIIIIDLHDTGFIQDWITGIDRIRKFGKRDFSGIHRCSAAVDVKSAILRKRQLTAVGFLPFIIRYDITVNTARTAGNGAHRKCRNDCTVCCRGCIRRRCICLIVLLCIDRHRPCILLLT